MDDTTMIAGIIVDKEAVHPGMPKKVEKAKIALVDSALEVKKTEIDAKIEITDPSQLHAFLDEEEKMLKKMVDIVKKSGANVLFCQKGIDDLAQHYLSKAGHIRGPQGQEERHGEARQGHRRQPRHEAGRPEGERPRESRSSSKRQKIADDRMTFVTGCKNPKAVSILIRGGTEHVVDEIDRSLNDAISVVAVAVEDGKLVTGGGSTAVEIAMKLREYAASIGGREQIAIDAFASALEVIPTALSENAGLDPIDVLIELRQAHKAGQDLRRHQRLHRQGRRHEEGEGPRTDQGRKAGHKLGHRCRGHDTEDRRRHRLQGRRRRQGSEGPARRRRL